MSFNTLNSTKIKARANYKCELCGKNPPLLHAHAPKGDHSNWENGIALCASCHTKQHPQHHMSHMVKTSFYIEESQDDNLKSLSLLTSEKVSWHVRQALDQYIKRENKK